LVKNLIGTGLVAAQRQQRRGIENKRAFKRHFLVVGLAFSLAKGAALFPFSLNRGRLSEDQKGVV
jgi:hypothetical protein